MNLKPIVASIMLLGLSGPAFAGHVMNSQTQLDAMKMNSSKADSLLSQNQGGTGLSSAETQGWFNALTVSGKINVDFLASNRTTEGGGNRDYDRYHGDHSNDLQLTDAAIFFDVAVNDWTKAHLGANFRPEANFQHGLYDSDTDDALVVRDFHFPIVDEAYITVNNCAQSPFYARVGRQYATFGNYDVYAPVPSLTQLLSETNQVIALAGFSDASSFNANIYTFRGLPKDNNETRVRVQNYGATVGFGSLDTMGYHVGLGYLNNLFDTAYLGNQFSDYTHRVRGLSADAAFQSGPFDVSVKYVAALNRFSAADLVKDANEDRGAKPWAAGVDVGYSFNTMQRNSRFGLSYQQTDEAAYVGALGLPEKRYQAEYTVNVSKNANLGFVVYRDRDYRVRDGGTNESNTTGVIRLGVDIV